MFLCIGLFQAVVTGSMPWNEDGIELDYNKNFHTRLLVPLRDFIQDGIHFTVIKTKHMYVLEDPNALQNMEAKPPASAKSKSCCYFEHNPTVCYVSYKIISESTLQIQWLDQSSMTVHSSVVAIVRTHQHAVAGSKNCFELHRTWKNHGSCWYDKFDDACKWL